MRWHRIDLKWCEIPLRGKFNFLQFKWCSDHYKITNSIWNFELSVHLPFVVSETSPAVCYSTFNSVFYWLLDSTSDLKGKKGEMSFEFSLQTTFCCVFMRILPWINCFRLETLPQEIRLTKVNARPCAFTTLPKCVCYYLMIPAFTSIP